MTRGHNYTVFNSFITSSRNFIFSLYLYFRDISGVWGINCVGGVGRGDCYGGGGGLVYDSVLDSNF